MTSKFIKILALVLASAIGQTALAQIDAAEIYCTIREEGAHLNCQWVGKESRRAMTPEETAQFIDKSEVAAYLSVRSRKGFERVFTVDPDASQFRRLSDLKKTGSISEIAKAKLELFAEVEKKAIKISDDLDAQAASMELVKYDPSVGNDKYKRELRKLDQELLTLKDSTAANQSFDNGPRAVDPNVNSSAYDARYVLMVGEGLGLNSVTADSAEQSTIGNFLLNFRLSWNENWISEIESRFGNQLMVSYGTGSPVSSLSPSDYTLKTERCWGEWCAEADVSNYSYVSLASGKLTSTARKFDIYMDTFYGLAAQYRTKWDKNLVYVRLGYQLGATNQNMGGAKPNSEGLLVGTLNWERQLTTHHGVVAQLAYESISATAGGGGQASVTNNDTLFGAFYKYSF